METEEYSKSKNFGTQEAQNKLMQLEQSLEQFSIQKKQFQSQRIETESAMDAIKGENEAYKMIGNLMVKQSAVELTKELKEKKETLTIRINTLEKQEEKLRAEVKEVQNALLKKMAQQSNNVDSEKGKKK